MPLPVGFQNVDGATLQLLIDDLSFLIIASHTGALRQMIAPNGKSD